MIRPSDPAFSLSLPYGGTVVLGVDLRTYLAGQALVGLLAFSPADDELQVGQTLSRDAAVQAVSYADALIAELAKPAGKPSA